MERLTEDEINDIERDLASDTGARYRVTAQAIRQLQAERDALIADNARLRERGPIDWREGPPGDDLKGTPVLIDGISGPHVAVWFDRYKTWWVGNNVDGFGVDPGDAARHCPIEAKS